MKNIIIILILLVSFIGCKKDESANKTYTISGTLNFDCNTPFANSDLQFYENATFLSHGGTIGTVKTDANGHFTFTYTARRNSTTISILTLIAGISPSCILDNIPEDCDIIEIKSYYSTQTKLIVKVSTSNPLSNNDTLFLQNLSQFYIGPFMNGAIVDTINGNMSFSLDYNDLKSPLKLTPRYWAIGKNNFINNKNTINFNYDRSCGAINILTIPIN